MKIIWKTIVLAILTSFLLYLWTSNFTPLQQHVNAEGEVSGSSIGGQRVESLNREEIISLLNSKILEWQQNPILLTGNNVDITLNPEWFSFAVESTVEQFENQVGTAWYAVWESEPTVHLPLQVVMSPELTALIEANGHLDAEATLDVIENQVGMLSSEPIVSVALDMSLFQTERIAFDIEAITMNTNSLNDIIYALNDQVIGSGEMFSVNEHIEGINLGNSDETINFVTSLLYSTVLQTNFEVVERHSQGSIPNYLEPGIEAKISKTKDLKFINTINAPASIKISIKGSELLVEIYSVPSETVAKYQVSESEITPRTIYRYSSELKRNEEELIQEGKPGLRVSVYRTISDKAGPFEKQDLISQDYYPPVNRIILKSSVVSETSTTLDPDLAVDMNGDGLTDINDEPSNTPNTNQTQDSEKEQSNPPNNTSPASEEDSDGLPEGSYYDKAGNIIDGSK
ncbi:VanW family protein [Psychrobacillus sp. NPDC096623]|uniref:VanW family protein n=1 Tax=Psychrobacillus sp. NPDC096623 TaxID=3364492 RepID=UPI0038154E29